MYVVICLYYTHSSKTRPPLLHPTWKIMGILNKISCLIPRHLQAPDTGAHARQPPTKRDTTPNVCAQNGSFGFVWSFVFQP